MEAQPSAAIPTTLRSPPPLDAYTPLAEHESRTPATFFGGPPVLHYYGTGARAYVRKDQQEQVPWESMAAPTGAGSESWPVLGEDMVQQIVDVFVGSDTLTLFSPTAGSGVALPYPVIGLHAIKSAHTADGRRVPTIYMQLEIASGSGGGEEEEPETVELTIVPAEAPATATATPAAAATAEATTTPQNGTPQQPPQSVSEASKLFDAISACADLHPDRFGDDDEDGDGYPSFFRQGANGEDGEEGDYDEEYDGEEDDEEAYVEGADGARLERVEGFRGVFRGAASAATTTAAAAAAAADLPPPMPGSGGWITAENAHEFFDEEGNWRGRGGSLGEGAGRVRGRDEVEAGESAAAAAAAAAEDENNNNDGEAGDTTASGGAQNGDSANGSNGAGEGGHDGGDGAESKRLRTE